MSPVHNDNIIEKAKTTAYRLLGVRARSEEELTKRLVQKNFSQKIIRRVILELKKLDLLNDTKFSADWIQARLKQGFALKRITLELKEKGICDSIIAKESKESLKNYSQDAVVQKLIGERIQQYQNLEKPAVQRRLYGYLIRRGFSSDFALNIIKKI